MKGLVLLLASVLFLGGRPAGAEDAGQGPNDDAREPIQVIKNAGAEPDSGRALRIAKKLGMGALWGIVPSYATGLFLTAVAGGTGGSGSGFGAGLFIEFSVLFGFPVGAAVGVKKVDPYDRFIYTLAGSAVGFATGLKLAGPHNYLIDSRWKTWPLYVFPLAGATIASELGRDPNKSQRFSINVPPVWGPCLPSPSLDSER